jgi:hypothetical protein
MSKNGDHLSQIERRESIERCPILQTNVRWPAPVDQRLNELIDAIVSRGFDATRSRLMAALVSTAPPDAQTLENMFREYLGMTAGKVVLQRSGPILVPERRPGRRAR